MVRRWSVFLTALLIFGGLYIAYQQWMAWLLLVAVFWLPGLSWLVSQPAMRTLRQNAVGGCAVPMGTPLGAAMQAACRYPVPRHGAMLRVERPMTGESWLLRSGQPLPTQNCGQLICRPERGRVYDYLGLFRRRVRESGSCTYLVRPLPVPMQEPEELSRRLALIWRPKPGGGFSENHELRLYRPGDSLNQVHWKLTAKTGKLIIREAMEPGNRRLLLTLDIMGTPEEMDRKLGRLLWLGKRLLDRGMAFEIQALTGEGTEHLKIWDEKSLIAALDDLLKAPRAGEGTVLSQKLGAFWHLHIGGDPDEG